jgi:hypothetical protein
MKIEAAAFLDGLRCGAKRTDELVSLASEYHGSAIGIEYMLTADIARARALVEVKIDVTTLRKVRHDLRRLCYAISKLKDVVSSSVVGASVFQVHIWAARNRYERRHFLSELTKVESKLESDLLVFSGEESDFDFKLHPAAPPGLMRPPRTTARSPAAPKRYERAGFDD